MNPHYSIYVADQVTNKFVRKLILSMWVLQVLQKWVCGVFCLLEFAGILFVVYSDMREKYNRSELTFTPVGHADITNY
jgi:hypothetical protein